MQEMTGDMWRVHTEIHCITTNGDINSISEAVMGRGCAKQAKDMFSGLAKYLANEIHQFGNHVADLGIWHRNMDFNEEFHLVSFPVKHHWHEIADTKLIKVSAIELASLADQNNWYSILLPRPGCGNGNLSWSIVKPIIEHILDNRFTIISDGRKSK